MNAEREPRRLLGRERAGLVDAMLEAYETSANVNEFVRTHLNPIEGTEIRVRSLDAVSTDRDPVPLRIGALIDYLAARDLVDKLVDAAHRANCTNYRMKRFHAEYFASVQRQVSTTQLERQVIPNSRYVDPAEWREDLERAERRVCRVQTTTYVGSGFLVARDVVITNQHVVADVIANPEASEKVIVQFDYRPSKASMDVRLHREWLLASSPPSPCELGDDDVGEPTLGQLDFAFVRLARCVGDDVVGEGPRGWFSLATVAGSVPTDSPMIVLQYPEGGGLKLAMETRSVIGVNANRTRVRYRTRTDPGSSGSPCFDQDWRVVALHQSGDPNFKRSAEYNQGIPIDTIFLGLGPGFRSKVGLR